MPPKDFFDSAKRHIAGMVDLEFANLMVDQVEATKGT
jgi:hypothetical protein